MSILGKLSAFTLRTTILPNHAPTTCSAPNSCPSWATQVNPNGTPLNCHRILGAGLGGHGHVLGHVFGHELGGHGHLLGHILGHELGLLWASHGSIHGCSLGQLGQVAGTHLGMHMGMVGAMYGPIDETVLLMIFNQLKGLSSLHFFVILAAAAIQEVQHPSCTQPHQLIGPS